MAVTLGYTLYWFHGYSERHNRPSKETPNRDYDSGSDDDEAVLPARTTSTGSELTPEDRWGIGYGQPSTSSGGGRVIPVYPIETLVPDEMTGEPVLAEKVEASSASPMIASVPGGSFPRDDARTSASTRCARATSSGARCLPT